ncbi:hypothetical protein CALVIDRAFT_598256 [Calocera viscosa TUFC12733]|uniref:G domain-containing protein n=1 Tax=Calocera viscosa (strain TUFC12733) TaxID=1330018 RepID=A0A167MHN9_CALVF|nr:hypothetical protein CALVIDRAFT_598256 [Calocera viscosa TUFC12733]
MRGRTSRGHTSAKQQSHGRQTIKERSETSEEALIGAMDSRNRKRKSRVPTTQPEKRPKIPMQSQNAAARTNNEVAHLVPPLPESRILNDPKNLYTPETTFNTLQLYIDYLDETLRDQRLALPRERMAGWADQINDLRRKCVPSTVIAVLGATGVGKSSLLNALLDQAELLPANCMRACTAAVVELAYHEKDTFEADVMFLSAEEWKQEAEYLQSDLSDEEGNMGDDDDDQVAIAKAKFGAVYPDVPLETLRHQPIEELLQRSAVQEVLGSIRHISCQTAKEFALELAAFIESKEDFTGVSATADITFQLWPLVKCIQCHVKADALATGAKLVDLPGTQDINIARAAIAKQYIKVADAFWIVAPINRAVSDKTAQDLLGDAFRRQLFMDGCYSDRTVTLVCSKTDQISGEEALRSLPHLKQNPDIRVILQKLKDLETNTSQYELALLAAEGKRAAKEEIQTLQSKISETRNEAKTYIQKRDTICALERNRYSKECSKKHFRVGLKQLDDAKREDTEDFQPAQSQNNFSQIDLPVFCASAQDYSKGKGLHGRNVQPSVFTSELDTEIPQLREHIKEITWDGRNMAVKKSIEVLEGFARSIDIYLGAEGQTRSAAGELFHTIFEQEMKTLSKAWEGVISGKCSRLKQKLRAAIGPVITQGAAAAQEGAVATVGQFGAESAWNTYKATMVREGIFKKNLNELLIEPIMKEVTRAWGTVFAKGVKALFLDLPELLMEKTNQTFKNIENKIDADLKDRFQIIAMQQRKQLMTGFKHIVETATQKLRHIQRDVSRQISPDIQDQLSAAYLEAGMQHGDGCFVDMKKVMRTHVLIHAILMFKHVATQTILHLDSLGDKVYNTMMADLVPLERAMRLNYSGIWEKMTATPDQILVRRAVRLRAQQLGRIAAQLLSIAKQADQDMRVQQQNTRAVLTHH